MKFVYFFAFVMENGHANSDVILPYQITTIEQIRDVEAGFRNKYGRSCAVISYQLLRAEDAEFVLEG